MRLVGCDQLETGTQLAEPIYGAAGQLLLQTGVELNARYIGALREQNLPAVYVSDPDTDGIIAPRPVRPETRAAARQKLADLFGRFTPAADELRDLSLSMTQEHAGTERFAQAVKAAFGGEDLDGIEQTVDGLISDLLNETVLVGLNSIKCHDAYTFQHSIDVTIMGLVLARKVGWDDKRVKTFGVGCLLHDIGKVLIPESVLNSPDKLSDEQFAQVKRHPDLGYQMIKAIVGERHALMPQVALQHHERQDGSGYPKGLEGTNKLGPQPPRKIHDFGALAAVADVYDAMSSTRSYRTAWAPDRVVAAIASLAGDHLNREAVDVFLSVVTPYPVCSEVTILTGRYAGYGAIVAKVDPDGLRRPLVRVLRDGDGARVEPFEIDLRVDQDIDIQSSHAAQPITESMGGRRKSPRTNDDLPADVLAALEQLRGFAPQPSRLPSSVRSRGKDGREVA